jgi:hypothetical protein
MGQQEVSSWSAEIAAGTESIAVGGQLERLSTVIQTRLGHTPWRTRMKRYREAAAPGISVLLPSPRSVFFPGIGEHEPF